MKLLQILTGRSQRLLAQIRFLLGNPIFLFVMLMIFIVAIIVIWVVWYVNRAGIQEQVDKFQSQVDLTFLVAGCALGGAILLATVLLFVFAIKQSRLNKQQRSFVSSVTHELRSPIASMQLGLETIQLQDLDMTTERKILSMLSVDLNRLMNLVDQLLVSSRLDRGIKIFDDVDTFEVHELIREVLHHNAHADATIEERIDIDCQPGLTLFQARPAMQLILSNLIENAIKYSPPRSKIHIAAKVGNGMALLTVKDHGFGLEKREKKQIFKIFRRGEWAIRQAIPGTGLGLHIVKTVAHVMGGRVWAESQGRNTGTTFYVEIPSQAELRS